MSDQSPSGWYPDPAGSSHRRFWTGADWGNLDNGEPTVFDPRSSSPAPPGLYPDPQGSSQRREWTGAAWGALEPAPVVAALPPAGTYPDPGSPGRERYWDGAAWEPARPVSRPPGSLAERLPALSRTAWLSVALAVVVIAAGGYFYLGRGSSAPATATTPTLNPAAEAAFCTNVAAFDTLIKDGPGAAYSNPDRKSVV